MRFSYSETTPYDWEPATICCYGRIEKKLLARRDETIGLFDTERQIQSWVKMHRVMLSTQAVREFLTNFPYIVSERAAWSEKEPCHATRLRSFDFGEAHPGLSTLETMARRVEG